MTNLNAQTITSDYVFKVTVVSNKTVIIDDLGGIMLNSHETYDLGKKFPLEKIKNSKSLAELIYTMQVYAWDSHGNQVGGFDLCDIEDCLQNSCCDDARDVVIFTKEDGDCTIDYISEYVALGRLESHLINILFERTWTENTENRDGSPFGTLWNFDGWDYFSEDGKITLHDLESRKWDSFIDALVPNVISDYISDNLDSSIEGIMFDIQSKKYYKIKFFSYSGSDSDSKGFSYIRELIKVALEDDCGDLSSLTFGTSVPDACDTYLYNNFGMSSNVAPHIVTKPSKIRSLNLSYQASTFMDGMPLSQTQKEAFTRVSPYYLQVEINGISLFKLPLPGEDWIGKTLNVQTCTILDIIEFFEGRSAYWKILKEYRDAVKELSVKRLEELLKRECVLGIYKNVELADVSPAEAKAISKRAELEATKSRLEASASVKEDLEKLKKILQEFLDKNEYVFGLYDTGTEFYQIVLRYIRLLRTLVLLKGDKISVYVGCVDDERAAVDGKIEDNAAQFEYIHQDRADILCGDVSNVNFVIELEDECDFTSISKVDGRITGRILDESGRPILDKEIDVVVQMEELDEDRNTDVINRSNFVVGRLPFGSGAIYAIGDGYTNSEKFEFTLDEKNPTFEIDFYLTEAEEAIFSGTLYDEGGNVINTSGLTVIAHLKDEKETNVTTVTDGNGQFSFNLGSYIGETIAYIDAANDGVTYPRDTYQLNSTIVAGDNDTEITITASRITNMTFVVMDQNLQQPIPGASITVHVVVEGSRTGSTYGSTTDSNGQSTFGIPSGYYEIVASGSGIGENTTGIMYLSYNSYQNATISINVPYNV